MSELTRDEPEYWTHMPADHTPAGLFVHGPQEALPVTTRLAKAPHYDEGNNAHEAVDREKLRRARMKFAAQQRLARAVAGFAVGRNRRRIA
jgi:hypothetical protein